jgi:hypothetical protein
MSFRNWSALIFRTVEHVFYEPAANELGMMKVLIFGLNSGRFISTSVYISLSQFSFTTAKNPSCCEVSRRESTVHIESYQWWFALLRKEVSVGFYSQMARKHLNFFTVEVSGHKLYKENYLYSPALFDDLYTREINCCGTVCHNMKSMPHDFGPQMLKMKKGDIVSWV